MSKRVNLFLSDEAIEILRQQDNMSRFVNNLILGRVKNTNDFDELILKIKELIQKNNVGNKQVIPHVKNSVMSLLDL